MKRIVDFYLKNWLNSPDRKPLLLRGARQIGKTYAARELGKQCEQFVEINFEEQPQAHTIFQKDLLVDRIIRELSLLVGKDIVPGKTLLFLDEVQVAPHAITALRYFYEKMPQLQVIAAGSLLDFAIEQVGMPVGRVQSLYMYPVSFIEFLAAGEHRLLAQELCTQGADYVYAEVIHKKLLGILGEYIALGGMPKMVDCWHRFKQPLRCIENNTVILDGYRQDFGKYVRNLQIKYVDLVFNSIPYQLGNPFKYAVIEGDYRKRELAPALDLLVTAGVAHKVWYSAGQGVPLGAQADLKDYKALLVDVGLSQALLNLDIQDWFIDPSQAFINKGALIEAFVGQEMLVYSNPHIKKELYYWHTKKKGSPAEIDYLWQKGEVVPIEVKSGKGTTLKSMHAFLSAHAASTYGIRFSTQSYSYFEHVYTYPLYAIARVLTERDEQMQQALASLVGS